MKLSVISPYDDNKLVYNNETDRYELTREYVKANFDVSFTNDATLDQRIKKNTRKIYNFIYYRAYSQNRAVVDFCLKRTEEGRKFILDVLTEQMEADIESGFNDLSSTPAVNFTSGRVIPREELQRNQISVDAEQIINRSSSYFNFNLMYQSLFPFEYFNFAQKNR